MKKWKEYMMLAVLCISMVGCGKKDSGSDLLTEVQETVTPVEEVVKPEGEETPEGIRLHVYSGDESAENIVQHTVYVNEITENTVMRELTEALERKCRDQLHFFWNLRWGQGRYAGSEPGI